MFKFLREIFFSSKKGTQFSLYQKIILPLYFKFLLRNCFVCRTVDYIKMNSNKNSLVNQIGSDVNKGIFYLFVITILIHYTIYNYILEVPSKLYFSGLSLIIFMFILAFFLINIFLLRSLHNNVIQKFDKIKLDVSKINKGDLSKRINIEKGSQELDELVYFTNDLLAKLEKSIESEKQKALIDPLTSCYNRRSMAINFEYIKNKMLRDKKTMSIVILDLDHFKKVNDKYGHKTGDIVLIEFVKIIQECIRNHDFVYRIGGEEFVIIFTNITKQKTAKILTRLKQNIHYKLIKAVPILEEPITVSGGFVSSRNYDLNEKGVLNKMIDDADKLLYEAKNTGRNKIIGK